jgi:apolipoprotein N-acyltransferase
MAISIETYDLNCIQRSEKIKMMSVQSHIKLCNDNIKFDDCHNFVNSILIVAENENVDILIFPEYSISLDIHSHLSEWSQKNNCVVIAGTNIIENYNTSTIFCMGKKYETQKLHLSPKET